MTDKPAKPAAKPAAKRASTRTVKPRLRKPNHDEISQRAYYIHLEGGGSDELENWIRAERELTAA
ncbi:MAG: DUF2934 domain-containing protein [Solirubrobacteraceae bacterium]|jgi:hypothetical protein